MVRVEPENGRPEALVVPELAGSDLGSNLGSADETSSQFHRCNYRQLYELQELHQRLRIRREI